MIKMGACKLWDSQVFLLIKHLFHCRYIHFHQKSNSSFSSWSYQPTEIYDLGGPTTSHPQKKNRRQESSRSHWCSPGGHGKNIGEKWVKNGLPFFCTMLFLLWFFNNMVKNGCNHPSWRETCGGLSREASSLLSSTPGKLENHHVPTGTSRKIRSA